MKIEDMKALCNEYTVDGYRRDIFYKTAINKFEALIKVAEEAKDYVEGRSVNMGTLELEDAIGALEKE